MPETAAQLEQSYVPDAGEKTRLLTLDHLDGRTLAVKRVRAVETQIASDLGGTDQLSEGQRALARRGAVLSAILDDAETRWTAGEPFDLSEYLAAINTFRRVLTTLGLERRPRSVNGGDRLGELLGDG
jgi:hypothetical protein